jgi:HK97 gp10 family phage protein
MSASILGIARTQEAFKRVGIEMDAAAPSAARAGGEVVARAAQARAPRRTGATAASIHVESSGQTALVGPTTPWAKFPEFGTVYIPAQRYMQDAADSSHTGIVAAMIPIFKAAIH